MAEGRGSGLMVMGSLILLYTTPFRSCQLDKGVEKLLTKQPRDQLGCDTYASVDVR